MAWTTELASGITFLLKNISPFAPFHKFPNRSALWSVIPSFVQIARALQSHLVVLRCVFGVSPSSQPWMQVQGLLHWFPRSLHRAWQGSASERNRTVVSWLWFLTNPRRQKDFYFTKLVGSRVFMFDLHYASGDLVTASLVWTCSSPNVHQLPQCAILEALKYYKQTLSNIF